MRRNAAVLVIDDEEIMRDILGTLLEREGYSVRLASSGQEGLDLGGRGVQAGQVDRGAADQGPFVRLGGEV